MTVGATLRCAVVSYWAPYLMLALVEGDEIIHFENPRFRRGFDSVRFEHLVADFIAKTTPEKLIADGRTIAYLQGRPSAKLFEVMSIDDAKRLLLEGRSGATHRELYKRLVAWQPRLKELIRVRITGKVVLSGFWPAAKLLPVALAFAKQRAVAYPSKYISS